jgi:hypothetical protein
MCTTQEKMKFIAAAVATATTFGRAAAATSTAKSGKSDSCHRPTGSVTFELEPLCFVENSTFGALEVCSPEADFSESMPWYYWQAKESNDIGCVDTKLGPFCNAFIIQCNELKNLAWNTGVDGALSSYDMCTAASYNFILEADIGYPTLNIASSGTGLAYVPGGNVPFVYSTDQVITGSSVGSLIGGGGATYAGPCKEELNSITGSMTFFQYENNTATVTFAF